jgi:YVTN family beta-propeller protein
MTIRPYIRWIAFICLLMCLSLACKTVMGTKQPENPPVNIPVITVPIVSEQVISVTPTSTLEPSHTPTPLIMCTPPPCKENEQYYCPGECPTGCGTTCATHTPSPDEFSQSSDGAFLPALAPLAAPFPGHNLSLDSNLPMCDDHMLQDRLAMLGYLEPGIPEWQEGVFGSETDAAVRSFEAANHLEVNGVVDWSDWGAMWNPAALMADGSPYGTLPSGDGEIPMVFQVLERPSYLAYDGNWIWVAHNDDWNYWYNQILAINPENGMISTPIMAGKCPPDYSDMENAVSGLVYDGTQLWFTLLGLSSVQPLDPTTGILVEPIQFTDYPVPQSYIAFDGQYIWVSTMMDIALRAIDPQSGEVVRSVELYGGPGPIGWDGVNLWVVNGGSVVEIIDPGTGNILQETWGQAGDIRALMFDGQKMWFADASTSTIGVIDPNEQSGTAGISISVGAQPAALAFDGRRMWVANSESGTIQSVDVNTLEVSEPITVGQYPVSLLYDGQRLWVANSGDGTVQYFFVNE